MKLSPPASSSDLDVARGIARRLSRLASPGAGEEAPLPPFAPFPGRPARSASHWKPRARPRRRPRSRSPCRSRPPKPCACPGRPRLPRHRLSRPPHRAPRAGDSPVPAPTASKKDMGIPSRTRNPHRRRLRLALPRLAGPRPVPRPRRPAQTVPPRLRPLVPEETEPEETDIAVETEAEASPEPAVETEAEPSPEPAVVADMDDRLRSGGPSRGGSRARRRARGGSRRPPPGPTSCRTASTWRGPPAPC